MAWVVSYPSIWGIRRSISTASKDCAARCSRVWCPSPATSTYCPGRCSYPRATTF